MTWLVKLFKRKREPQAVTAKRPSFLAPPVTVDWTVGDVIEARRFLSGETGRKFVEICGAEALREAMAEVCGDRTGPRAAGMDAMLRFQFNLASDALFQKISSPTLAKVDHTTDGQQDEAGLVEIRSF